MVGACCRIFDRKVSIKWFMELHDPVVVAYYLLSVISKMWKNDLIHSHSKLKMNGSSQKKIFFYNYYSCLFASAIIMNMHKYLERFVSLFTYRIVASTSPSRIEAHAGLFRSLMKGIFDPYVLWPFDKKLIF